jgi:hypothetical protein
MNMPGFTAEASLKEVSNRYSAAGLVWQPSQASQAIHPAQTCVSACFMQKMRECYQRWGPWCPASEKADAMIYCRRRCGDE